MTKNEIAEFFKQFNYGVREELLPCPGTMYRETGLVISYKEEQENILFFALNKMGAKFYSPRFFCIGKTWCKMEEA